MENIDSSIDWISSLPDSLLTHILSFVTTKEAVHTSILSKRWKDVWVSVPVLDFHSNQFRQPNVLLEDQDNTQFVQFVDGVFDHRETVPLEKFGLSYEGLRESDIPCFIEILDRAAECMPRAVSVSISTGEFLKLPDSIFTCASLEEMSLSFDAPDTFVAPESINLPSLKKLELVCLDVEDDFIRGILLGCPILEELVMSYCILDIDEITSDKLKKLVLNMCVQLSEVHISCPAVASLRIKHIRGKGIRLRNVSSLAIANVCFEDAVLNDSISKYLELLSDLSNVASLRLHTSCLALQALLVGRVPKFPRFKNLKSLDLGSLDMRRDFDLVLCFLKQAPNLKKLILRLTGASKEATDEELLGGYSFLLEYYETNIVRCATRDVKMARRGRGSTSVYHVENKSLFTWSNFDFFM